MKYLINFIWCVLVLASIHYNFYWTLLPIILWYLFVIFSEFYIYLKLGKYKIEDWKKVYYAYLPTSAEMNQKLNSLKNDFFTLVIPFIGASAFLGSIWIPVCIVVHTTLFYKVQTMYAEAVFKLNRMKYTN